MQAGIAACVPDRVPLSQRGAVSGWLGAPQCVGVVLAVFLVSKVAEGSTGYLVLAVLTVALAFPFVLAAQEPAGPGAASPVPAAGVPEILPAEPRPVPGLWLGLADQVPDRLRNSAAVLYLLYFLRDRVHYSSEFPGQTAEDGLVILLLVYTVVVVITAVVSGVLSDRGGWRRAPVVLSGGVMAIPAVMLALWSAWPVVLAGAAILGLGFGIYLSVDQALVTQVLPAASGHGRQRRSDLMW
jgi:hypothetical protein